MMQKTTQSVGKNRKAVAAIMLAALSVMIIAAAGCGGGGGGAASSAAPAKSGYGRVAAAVKFAIPASAARAASAAGATTLTVNIAVSITGFYADDDKAFATVTTSVDIPVIGGHAQAVILNVPIGTNHLLTAVANWPGGSTDTIKCIIPQVLEGETEQSTADYRTTVIADAAIAAAQRDNVHLSKVTQAQIDTFAAAVDALHNAGSNYGDIRIQDVLNYGTNSSVVTSVTVSPATATVVAGATAQFTATPRNTYGVAATATVTWSVTGSIGTIASNGLFTASSTGGGGTVVAAAGSISGSAAVAVTPLATCGNGAIEPGETCDDGANNGHPNHCNSSCSGTNASVCGNNMTEAGETCDDGNTITESCAYGQTSCTVCNTTCQSATGTASFCGDSTINSANGETCDDGANNGQPGHCNSTCNGTTASTCGNGLVEAGETCDDGNTITESCAYGLPSCTVCNSACQNATGTVSFCGDTTVNSAAGEICDDGANNGHPNHCNSTCNGTTAPVCGNSAVETGETCDDGNNITETCAYGQTNCTVCNSACQSATGTVSFCGDSVVNSASGETCDEGASNGQPNHCNGTCNGTVPANCGNSTIDPGETCDDGANNGQPNHCNSMCDGTTASACGNSIVEAGETCDDGNGTTETCAYGLPSCMVCNSVCQSATGTTSFCGDSMLNSADGETCDDGVLNGQPGHCDGTCNGTTVPACGNSVVEAGEVCDDGVSNGQPNQCDSSCTGPTAATCGNSIVEAGETCDDGNTITEACAYGLSSCMVCDSVCQSTAGAASFCGDSMLNSADGETCDDGPNNGLPNYCDFTCNGTTAPVCGNNAVEAGEACDDGVSNTNTCPYGQPSCMVCNTSCQTTSGAPSFCGDYIVQAGDGETCDDGPSNGLPNQCNASCNGITVATCGNSVVEPGESCDDGNFTPGDGCDATCHVEGIVQNVSAGEGHTCAIVMDGEIKCWGTNSYGQLGDGSMTPSSTPVPVIGISTAMKIAAGYTHTCAILNNQSVQCWGDNTYGQLGDGSTTQSLVPVGVNGLGTTALAVSAGISHTCALLSDGTVQCWGDNGQGQLGNATTTQSLTPVTVSGIATAIALASGAHHSCALLLGGSIKCWGDGLDGQLGDGSTTWSDVPVPVTGISTATALGMGHAGNSSCAVLTGGTIKCWGDNMYGQLGNNSSSPSSTPVAVSGINNAAEVSIGQINACAALTDGTIKCWGADGEGEFGNGTMTDSHVPVPGATGITSAMSISTGFGQSCSVLQGFAVYCWGYNSMGKVGDGTTIDKLLPTLITMPGI